MVITYLVASFRPSADTLTPELFHLRPSFLAWGSTLTLARMGLWVKVVDQRSRSNAKNRLLTSLLPCLRSTSASRSKVWVKVMGQGQSSRSNFWQAAVDIRGSALPSAAKSITSHYQSKVFVCVSVISGCITKIARMRPIGYSFISKTGHSTCTR